MIGRRFDCPVLNFGFSGCGRMDVPVIDLLNEITPALYVLDCLENMRPSMVAERAEPAVRSLREKHPDVPILLVECHDYPTPELFPGQVEKRKEKQAALRAAYDKLIEDGVKHLYYLNGRELIGLDSEGTGDGIHPNALGTSRYVDAYEAAIRNILKR